MYREDASVPLGLRLAAIGTGHPTRDGAGIEDRNRGRYGVVVARIASEGLVGQTKRVRAGDVLHAVNGVVVASHTEAKELLRHASGVIQFVVTRTEQLPDGWEQKADKEGTLYYLQRAQGFWSFTHPLSINHDASGNVIKAQGVESVPQGERTYRDGIEEMSTRAMMVETVQDEAAGKRSSSSSKFQTTSL